MLLCITVELLDTYIQVLMDLAKAPKLATGDYAEVVKTLKKLMGDSMVSFVCTNVYSKDQPDSQIRRKICLTFSSIHTVRFYY
jgi:hypothetical protein